ncbi:hypothetical protein N7474_007667 [Penicillium riverlandense]|uniref:uncharacterized protein n=1 Tax=Penicillium riverlandense TaxID=1903569 RepID=UPI002547BFFF|nr:uncharacterized protein N7474_007667 [Penicillium riverlandense]KAJ5811366.1 hypothetical protein N7474_007667 [Penicillium riverlandense]
MATQPQPSLLQYARFHGIAVPAKDPLSYLETNTFYSCPIDKARGQVEWHLETEKLEIRHSEAALLSSIIRSKPLHGQMNWNALLPSVQHDDSLKLDLLLTAEAESVLSDPVSRLGDRDVGALLPSAISPSYPREYQGMKDTIDQCTAQMMSEKLDCSKDSLVLIPSGKRLSKGDIDACFRNMMLQKRVSIFLLSPFGSSLTHQRNSTTQANQTARL